jgi:hypothetical protein
MYGPFWKHVTDFWKIRNEDNIMFYTYENMQKVKFIHIKDMK